MHGNMRKVHEIDAEQVNLFRFFTVMTGKMPKGVFGVTLNSIERKVER